MLEALLIFAAASAVQTADPLAQARGGKVQCIVANAAAKTCSGMARYKINADGTFETVMTLLIAPQPLLTMTVTSGGGTVTKGALCGPFRKSEFESAKFEMDGQPASEAMAMAIRSQVVGSIEAMDGKMSCATEAADGTVTVTLDGVAHPEMTQKVLWVKPDEGYKLGQ